MPLILLSRATPTPTPLPSGGVVNGDFENGRTAWLEYSSNGYPLILSAADLLVPPHSGSWAAWLGGADNEDSVLWQVVTIPQGNPTMNYWLWIASADVCGYDVAGVAVNLSDVVDAFWLCYANNSNGWVARTVDLSSYSGQAVELDIVAFTDDTLNSNLFVDDVSLGNSALSFAESLVAPDVVPDYTTPKSANPSLVQASRGQPSSLEDSPLYSMVKEQMLSLLADSTPPASMHEKQRD
jgi:hypothetical protein